MSHLVKVSEYANKHSFIFKYTISGAAAPASGPDKQPLRFDTSKHHAKPAGKQVVTQVGYFSKNMRF